MIQVEDGVATVAARDLPRGLTGTAAELPEGGRAPAAPHVAPLDGLRGVAILMVVLFHAALPGMGLGWLGVDLFFVLSGFLITTLLVREHAARGRVSLFRFWGRRFLRLMPLYWLNAAALTAVILGTSWAGARTYGAWTPGRYVASIWGYFVNFAPLFNAVWEYQQKLSAPLWSLALEEQYYFAWPVVCALMLRSRWLPRLAWALVALVALRHRYAGPAELFAYPTARGLGLVLGSAVALSLALRPNPRTTRRLGAPALRWGVALATLLVYGGATVAVARGWVGSDFRSRWLVPLVCPFYAACVAMLWYGPHDRLARAFSWGPLAYVGRISYGMYLLNSPMQVLTWDVLLAGIGGWPGAPKYALRLAVYLALTVGAASASHHFYEKRFLALKDRLR